MGLIVSLIILGVVVLLVNWIIGQLGLPEPVRIAIVVLIALALFFNEGYGRPIVIGRF